jgi:preprotein translocase subunit SecB
MTKVVLGDARELARVVLDRVESCGIRLARLNLEAQAPGNEVALRTDTALTLGASVYENAVVCLSKYEISAEPDESSAGDEDRWSIVVEMHGMWTLTDGPQLTTQHAQAFALAVGAMALHPYVRSQVQSTIGASGYPMFTLDVLHSLLEPSEEDGLVDLDLVTVIGAEPVTEVRESSPA